jgi:hypothetical protein
VFQSVTKTLRGALGYVAADIFTEFIEKQIGEMA